MNEIDEVPIAMNKTPLQDEKESASVPIEARDPVRRKQILPLILAGAVGIAISTIGWIVLPSVARNPAVVSVARGASVPIAPVGLRRDGENVIVPEGSPYRSRIAVAPVEQRILGETVVLPASVEADPARVFNLLPPLGGRVIELKVGLGDRVKLGQPLVVIDSGDLAQAYSDVDKARAQAALTHRALDRARGVTQAGGGAVKDLESAANDAAQADAEFARAQGRLKTIAGNAALSGNRTFTVAAPASGTVTALAVARGAYINDPTQTLLTISNLDQVWVTANVPEIDTGVVSKGQDVDVTFIAYPGDTFRGTVLFVNDVLEPDTRRTKVRIGFANPEGRFKPNMFATVAFHAPPRSALFVPNGALLMNNDSTTVFVETAPWTFVRRTVKPGYDVNGHTVIDDGLKPNDRVVSRGGVLLND